MSESFVNILQYVLAIGNYLNNGTMKGGAYGFKLSSLEKVRIFLYIHTHKQASTPTQTCTDTAFVLTLSHAHTHTLVLF